MENFETSPISAQMPYSLEAEQSVLGCVLLDFSCISDVMQYISADSFYRKSHQEIFSIMLSMFSSGSAADYLTILETVRRAEIFESDEDAKVYLTSLAQSVPSIANVVSYAQIVQEKAYLRSLLKISQDIMTNVAQKEDDPKKLLDSVEQRIFEIRQGREAGGLTRIDEILIQAYDKLQKLSSADSEKYKGLSSGFKELDNVTTGLNPSDLIILAARPGMGKTSFALNIATNVAKKAGKDVAVFSLEMSKEQLALRLLSSEARVVSNALRTGELSSDDWERIAVNAEALSKAPLYIDDTGGISVAEIKAKCRRLKNLGLIVIDYLQLMTSSRRSDNRVLEVSEMTRNLKLMARELNVPIITLSQLSRGPEARTDKRPMMSDLRESGSIEQDADLVLFLYRDEYYNKESDPHIAECIVGKNRHGETSTIQVAWDGKYTRFSGLEKFRSEN